MLLAAQLAAFPSLASATDKDKPAAPNASSDAILGSMQTELTRAKTDLTKSDPAPYFISYTVYDQDSVTIAASYGGLLTDTANRRRSADITRFLVSERSQLLPPFIAQ